MSADTVTIRRVTLGECYKYEAKYLGNVMAEVGNIKNDELEEVVVDEMKDVGGEASLDEIMDEADITNKKEAKTVMRGLINDGKVSTTPEWDYKLASRLRR